MLSTFFHEALHLPVCSERRKVGSFLWTKEERTNERTKKGKTFRREIFYVESYEKYQCEERREGGKGGNASGVATLSSKQPLNHLL